MAASQSMETSPSCGSGDTATKKVGKSPNEKVERVGVESLAGESGAAPMVASRIEAIKLGSPVSVATTKVPITSWLTLHRAQFRRFDHADRTSENHGQEWQDRQCVGRCEGTPAC